MNIFSANQKQIIKFRALQYEWLEKNYMTPQGNKEAAPLPFEEWKP